MRWLPQRPAVHGGESPLPIDLSASLNPLGPSESVLAAVRATQLSRYPEPDAASLAAAAGRHHGIPTEAVAPVPGASFGLWLALLALLEPAKHCLGLAPCFGEYARYAAIAGAVYREARCPGADQSWTEADLERTLAPEPAVCVLGNPANPAGTRLEARPLRRLCERHPRTRFVIDEAFAGFAPAGTSLIEGRLPPRNCIVVRSLTKELALPGLRVGYLVAEPGGETDLSAVLPAWPLSAPALAAGVAACANPGHTAAGAATARAEVELLAEALRRQGWQPLPSCVNYLLCRAPGLADHLARSGIAVRRCDSFGLPGFVRIAAPAGGDLNAVLAAIGEFRP